MKNRSAYNNYSIFRLSKPLYAMYNEYVRNSP